jgi:hypothetical protein
MKKLLLTLIAFLPVLAMAQTPIEGRTETQTVASTSYITVYNETPTKVANKFYSRYAFPWRYSNGYIRPAAPLTDRVMIGTTGNYPYSLYNAGLTGFGDDVSILDRKKLKIGSMYLTTDANGNGIVYDPILGTTKTFTELASGGVADLTNVDDGGILFKRGDTISSDPNIKYSTGVIRFTQHSGGPVLTIDGLSGGALMQFTTEATDGVGIRGYAVDKNTIAFEGINYSDNGYAFKSINASPYPGVYATTDSSGAAIYATTTYTEGSDGPAIYGHSLSGGGIAGKFVSDDGGDITLSLLNHSISTSLYIHNYSTGYLINATTPTKGIFKVSTDSVYLMYLYGGPDGGRFAVINSTGAIDSGTLENASEQLAKFLAPLPLYFWDRKNGELSGFYTGEDGKLVKNYGLKDNKTGKSLGLESIEMLMGHVERNYRFSWRLWLMVMGLIGFTVYQQIQIIKLKRKCGI